MHSPHNATESRTRPRLVTSADFMAPRGTLINFADADPEVQALARQSSVARQNAYCPFSNFAVGAALKATNGTVYSGCNVENSAYGGCICAERTACTKAVSEGSMTFSAIAVCADKAVGEVTSPCGTCRQFLYEFAPELPVYCVTSDLTQILVTSIKELLPYGFRLNGVKCKY